MIGTLLRFERGISSIHPIHQGTDCITMDEYVSFIESRSLVLVNLVLLRAIAGWWNEWFE